MVGLHACICQRIMWHVSVSPLLFKFQIKKMDRSTFSMLIHVGFYGLKHLYAHIPIFLYTHPYVSMVNHLSILVSLGFYAYVKL